MTGSNLAPATLRELRFDIEDFNTAYAGVLDAMDIEAWPDFFIDDCFYRITARENHEADMEVGLVWCECKAMLIDHAVAVRATMVHAPRYLRHYTSNVRVTGIDDEGRIGAESNYLVVETLMEDETRILQAGRYIDLFVRDGSGLLLASRDCIYDSLLIPNDLVYPV